MPNKWCESRWRGGAGTHNRLGSLIGAGVSRAAAAACRAASSEDMGLVPSTGKLYTNVIFHLE